MLVEFLIMALISTDLNIRLLVNSEVMHYWMRLVCMFYVPGCRNYVMRRSSPFHCSHFYCTRQAVSGNGSLLCSVVIVTWLDPYLLRVLLNMRRKGSWESVLIQAPAELYYYRVHICLNIWT